MHLTSPVRSAVASVSLLGFGMLASPWRAAPQDPHRDELTRLAAQDARLTNLQRQVSGLMARLAAHEAVLTPENGVKLMKMLPHMGVVEKGDIDGSTSTTIVFEKVNVQIVNGLGATNGVPDAPWALDPTVTRVNGLGNLFIGYNESRSDAAPLDHSGSHNLVVGVHQRFISFGGFVAGAENTVSSPYSSVSGGSSNTASGNWSSVTGGSLNTANGTASSVSGGSNSTASGSFASISGGVGNTASGAWSSISAGSRNNATGLVASISGGGVNVSSGNVSSISGGTLNTASGSGASISGGEGNIASGARSSVNGGLSNTAAGDPFSPSTWTSVSGGMNNTASASGATVSGGCGVTVSTSCGHQ